MINWLLINSKMLYRQLYFNGIFLTIKINNPIIRKIKVLIRGFLIIMINLLTIIISLLSIIISQLSIIINLLAIITNLLVMIINLQALIKSFHTITIPFPYLYHLKIPGVMLENGLNIDKQNQSQY